MPGNLPGRPGGEHEPLLDMIFERRPIPPGAPREIHDLARMLTAAAGSAEPGELAGEAAALTAFGRQFASAGTSRAARRPARRRPSGRPVRGKISLAAALIVTAAGLSSTAAAYADALPGPIQHLAHRVIGAPDRPAPGTQRVHVAVPLRPGPRPHPQPSPSSGPERCRAHGTPAHDGLCTAASAAKKGGPKPDRPGRRRGADKGHQPGRHGH